MLHLPSMRVGNHSTLSQLAQTRNAEPRSHVHHHAQRPTAADRFDNVNQVQQTTQQGAAAEAAMQVLVDALVELLQQLIAKAAEQTASNPPPTTQPTTAPSSTTTGSPQTAPPSLAAESSPAFTVGNSAPVKPPSANLPDVSNEPIPLDLEDFAAKYRIAYGEKDGFTCWHKTDGTQITPREEAIALRRAEVLGPWHISAVGAAANNARVAGTMLTTTNMQVFLGDENAPRDGMTGLRGMNPQWVPGQGPPPAFDGSGAPIPGATAPVNPLMAAVTASSTSTSPVAWPPAPATAEQRAEYQRFVTTMRSGQGVITSGNGPGLPPPENPETVVLAAKKALGSHVSVDQLADLSSRLVLDAVRFEASASAPGNFFHENPALFDAFKRGDADAFAAALGVSR